MAKAPVAAAVIVPTVTPASEAETALQAALEAQSETITALNAALTERTEELSGDIDQCQAELENEILQLRQQLEENANEIQGLMVENRNLSTVTQAQLSTLQALQGQLRVLEERTPQTPAVIVEPENPEATPERKEVPEKPRRRFL